MALIKLPNILVLFDYVVSHVCALLNCLLSGYITAFGQITNSSKERPGHRGKTSAIAVSCLYHPKESECFQARQPVITRKDIYHEGWID